MKRCLHFLVCFLFLFVVLGLPFVLKGITVISGETDAVSSASLVIKKPSGRYVAYLNQNLHEAAGTVDMWTAFLRGEEIGVLFEDLSCAVLKGDTAAYEMAASLSSRLPENQMRVRMEDPVLLLSKALFGRFDVIVMSEEAANVYDTGDVEERDFVIRIPIRGKNP